MVESILPRIYSVCEDESDGRTQFGDRRFIMVRKQSASAAASSSSSRPSPPLKEKSGFRSIVTALACGACMFCVCCPIAIVQCCIIFPSKFVWRLAKRGKCGGVSCFNGYRRVSSAGYSSFSDMDFDDPAPRKSLDSSTGNVYCRRRR